MVFLFYVSHDENDISGSLARHEAKTREDILEVGLATLLSRGAQSTELVSLYIGYWTLNNYYYYYYTADRIVVNAELLPCTDCGTDIITELLNCFANILLKNYSTTKSETESRSK